MPALDTLQLPRIDMSAYGGREAKKLAAHLYQVEEQLRYVLGHLDEDNLSEGLKAKLESGGLRSEIEQTLSAITLRVNGQDDAMAGLRVSLSGISAAVQEQGGALSSLAQTAQSITGEVQANKTLAAEQTAAALAQARQYTDAELEAYPTSAEMSSLVRQTAESITADVAAAYSTKEELTSQLRQTAESITATVSAVYAAKSDVSDGDAATLAAARSEIKQTAGSIRLTVANGETGSTFTLTAGETTLSSGSITFTGLTSFVSRSDLSEPGRTVINGANITTGTLNAGLLRSGVLESESGNTRYDLGTGSLRSGPTTGTRVEVDANRINWYAGNYLTGVVYSVVGTSYLGANSRWVNYGWVNGSEPTEHVGLQIDHEYNTNGQATRAVFNTAVLDVSGGNLGVNGRINCTELAVSGTASKQAVVPTEYGTIRLYATESPAPCFQDWGGGVCDEKGDCAVLLDERFLAVTAAGQKRRWAVTGTDRPDPLWAEETGGGAVVHGAPGQSFDWICFAAQRGAGGLYAEPYLERDTAQMPDTPGLLQTAMCGTAPEADSLEKLLWEAYA